MGILLTNLARAQFVHPTVPNVSPTGLAPPAQLAGPSPRPPSKASAINAKVPASLVLISLGFVSRVFLGLPGKDGCASMIHI